jgi:hypothetical protein
MGPPQQKKLRKIPMLGQKSGQRSKLQRRHQRRNQQSNPNIPGGFGMLKQINGPQIQIINRLLNKDLL